MTNKLLLETNERSRLAADLRQAIRENGLKVVYQPIVDVSGEKTLAVEALCRWRHPLHGDVPPTEFIPLAEEAGLIAPLGEWVLRQACLDARDWQGVRIAVNVSPTQFRQPAFLDTVSEVLAETGLEPGRLELEMTESLLVDDVETAQEKLSQLRELGVHLALDDFGTGYSSLNYLVSLPFDKLKIDRSFVLKLENGWRGAAIIHSIVGLGRALGLHVTAEGIETADQHRFLRIAGVHSFQGYHFSRPVDAQTISQRLASERDARPPASPGRLSLVG